MTIAPPALEALTKAFAARHDRPDSYVMGGIVGDAAHMNPPEGYHVSYNNLGGNCSKYGLAFPGDCAAGKAHPDWASAWDLSMDNADMITVTNRLITAAKAKDPRVSMLWEIAGTTNGTNVHAYYLNSDTDDPTNKQQWAASHLHHVHLSFKRSAVADLATLVPLLDVICGIPLHTDFLEEIMALDRNSADYKAFMADVRKNAALGTADCLNGANLFSWHDKENHGLDTNVRLAVEDKLAAVGLTPKAK